MEHTIDAQGKSVGRIATEVAVLLMGKNTSAYKRNIAPNVAVRVTNAGKMKIHPKNLEGKIYTRYSGYPGGLKKQTLEDVIERKGYGEVLRVAVRGMLPNNTLRDRMLTHLIVNE